MNKKIMENKKSIEIIIARYNESLLWINQPPFHLYNSIIYNKGINNDFVKLKNTKIIELPNIGRETHTFLFHIIENYDNLAEISVFFMGSIDMIHKYERAKRVLYQVENTPNISIFSGKKYETPDLYFQLETYRTSNHKNRQINDSDELVKSQYRPFGKWMNHFLPDIRKIEGIAWNSIMAIHRNDILQFPKSYYENLITEVSGHKNMEAGHFFERAWVAIFGCNNACFV